jgi:hypothetical protein
MNFRCQFGASMWAAMAKAQKPIFLRVNLQKEINDGDSYQIASVICVIDIN